MDALVSVIIPCYNSSRFLDACVRSVLGQTYPHLEILCVDNGSSDNTVALINQLCQQDKRVHLLHQPKKGAAAARNLGLEKSSGKYIQFLDSDDLITPEKIEVQLKFLLEKKAEVVISDREIFDETLTQKLQQLTFNSIEKNPLATAVSSIIITGNPLYTKEAVQRIGGYREDLKTAQDWDFHMRLFISTSKIAYTPGFFLMCRQVGTSLSSNWKEVSIAGAYVLKTLEADLLSRALDKDHTTVQKVVHVLMDAAIYAPSKKDITENHAAILKWTRTFNASSCYTGISAFLIRVLGIKGFIRIKRLFR